MNYGKNLLIAIDQLINAVFGGWCDETMSSQAYRWAVGGVREWPRKLIDGLFWFDPNHCYESYQSERKRAQMPPELR